MCFINLFLYQNCINIEMSQDLLLNLRNKTLFRNSLPVLPQQRDFVSSKWAGLFMLDFCWLNVASWPIAALISRSRNMFLSNRVSAHASSTSRVSNAMESWQRQWSRLSKSGRSAKFTDSRQENDRGIEGDKEREKGAKAEIPCLNNRGWTELRSFYKEIGWSLCYTDLGADQFCCQFRCQFRCQSRRRFLTRIIASRKRFDNFY